MGHSCSECFLDADVHPERCNEGHDHWPPLCCPGCFCSSYEEAHGLPTLLNLMEATMVEAEHPFPPKEGDRYVDTQFWVLYESTGGKWSPVEPQPTRAQLEVLAAMSMSI